MAKKPRAPTLRIVSDCNPTGRQLSRTLIALIDKALRAPCVSARSIRRCSGCRQEWRCRICLRGALIWPPSGRSNRSGKRPTFLAVVAIVAASHAIAGRTGQARSAVEYLRKLDSMFRISGLEGWIPIPRPEHLAQFTTGRRMAGRPE